MFLLDTMLIGGIRFVLDKVATAVDTELNDETRLREELLAAEMRLELGEIDEEEFRTLERDLLDRLRAIREEREEEGLSAADMKVTGVEATFGGDEET